ncbi:MAG: hypothetical protein LBE98_00670 [Puniceicoccales bacterium]|nr:hypothetical protein [Puniceicoccales bacterium]
MHISANVSQIPRRCGGLKGPLQNDRLTGFVNSTESSLGNLGGQSREVYQLLLMPTY